MLEVTLRWTIISSKGGRGEGRNTPSRFMLQKQQTSAVQIRGGRPDGSLGSYADFIVTIIRRTMKFAPVATWIVLL